MPLAGKCFSVQKHVRVHIECNQVATFSRSMEAWLPMPHNLAAPLALNPIPQGICQSLRTLVRSLLNTTSCHRVSFHSICRPPARCCPPPAPLADTWHVLGLLRKAREGNFQDTSGIHLPAGERTNQRGGGEGAFKGEEGSRQQHHGRGEG